MFQLAVVVVLAAASDPPPASSPSPARDIAALIGVRSAGGPSFSPDGKHVAFVSNITGVPQVWTVPVEGGWPNLVTNFEDPVSRVVWGPGERLAVQVAPGGGMNQQVWTLRSDGSEAHRLTPGGKETNELFGWDHSRRRLLVGSNVREPASTDIYVLGESDAALGAPAVRGQGLNSVADVGRDPKTVLIDRLVSRGSNDLYLGQIDDGAEVHLTPHEGPGNFAGLLSPDGRTVWMSSDKDRDLAAFGRVRLGPDHKPGPFEPFAERRDAELEGFDVDEAGTHALLIWNVAGRSELTMLDLRTAKSRPVPSIPVDVVFGVTHSDDGRRWAFAGSAANRPTDIWVLDAASLKARQLTHSAHPGVALDTLVRPELVRFEARDGVPLSGWLYRAPSSSGPGPVVLSFHGGPEGQERPFFAPTYQLLLRQGISVFAPNVRGSTGYGKRFLNLDNGALRVNAVKDIEDCTQELVRRRVADPKRLGIMGGSYGGYMVMAGVTEFPSLFAGGVDLFGIVNFETFFRDTEPWMAAISTVEYGDPKTQPELLKQLSPIHKLDAVRTPLLVLHGANDTNVPVVEAEQVVAALKKNGVPVEYVLFQDEGHGFRKLPNRIQAATATVDFFRRTLAATNPAIR